MENQHKKIKTYRDLTQEEIDMMNEIKELESKVAEVYNKLLPLTNQFEPLNALYEAKSNLKTGFMHLVRAVAKPDSPWNI